MSFILSILVLGISWLIGVVGWAQVVGGFQNLGIRSNMILTIIIWLAIIFACVFLVRQFFADKMLFCFIGLAISFVQVLMQGKIE